MISDNNFHSHHIFLFPFKWEQFGKNIEQRFDLEELAKKIEINVSNWERKPFELNHEAAYNEHNYFYRQVRGTLYDKEADSKAIIHHYEYKLDELKTYNIQVGDQVYSLDIDSIIMNVYATGMGVISFHLRNTSYAYSDDILKINQYGRRLYPPFLDVDSEYTRLGDSSIKLAESKLLKNVKESELADAIWLGGVNHRAENSNPYYEDFSSFIAGGNFPEELVLPKFILSLFNEGFLSSDKQLTKEDKTINLDLIVDDRMHLISWYGKAGFTHFDESIYSDPRQISAFEYWHSEWWYKYVNVDGGEMTMQNRSLAEEYMKKMTYDRWKYYHTLFGVSRYSFVAISKSFSEIPPFVVQHIQSIYYKMVELCLIQRASILSLKEEATRISSKAKFGCGQIREIKELYHRYIFFKNQFYHKEVTAQEQGIELYDMIKGQMRIDEYLATLENEIKELYDLAILEEQSLGNKRVNRLTIIATAFAIPALILSILASHLVPSTEYIPECIISWRTYYAPFWKGLVGIGGISILIFSVLYLINIKTMRK